jgi:hypothetical protein
VVVGASSGRPGSSAADLLDGQEVINDHWQSNPMLSLPWIEMPTVLRIRSTRFFFYSNEGSERAHIHIEQAGALAKFWLDPVSLAASSRFSGQELRQLERQVSEHRQQFLEAWHDYFGA